MGDHLTQIGIGGIFALLVIRMVFEHVQKTRDRKNGTLPLVRVGEVPQECHDALQGLTRMCKELKDTTLATGELVEKSFDMHNVRDSSGQPVWYTGRLAEAVIEHKGVMEALAVNVKEQTFATKELLLAIQKLHGERQHDRRAEANL
jgi:hypothetical protein